MRRNTELFQFGNEFPLTKALVESTRTTVKNGEYLRNVADDLEQLLASNELSQLINSYVEKLISVPESDPPFMQQEHIVLCQDFGGALIAIGRTEVGNNVPLYSVTAEALLGAVSANGFTYRMHQMPTDWDQSVFNPEIKMQDAETKKCEQGHSLLLSTTTLYDYASTGDIVIKIVGPNHSALMWEFDRATRKAVSVHAATPDATIITYLMKFLAEHGNARSVNAIRHMLKHQFHYIRWDAVKALGKIDGNELKDVLKILLDDPHPHVRNASLKTMTQLGM